MGRTVRRVGRNGLGEAALFLVPTIYTSIRNNDGCHRTEQERELLDANAPRSLMEPIFNSARLHFLRSFTYLFYPISSQLSSKPRSRARSFRFYPTRSSHYVRFFYFFTCNAELHTNFSKKKNQGQRIRVYRSTIIHLVTIGW